MNDKLTLQELIDLLAARHQMEPQDADAFVREFWALIEEGLKSDNYVKIKGLGTFKLIDTEARESINIQTGERIEIQSHARITFTPEAALRDLINRPFAHFETVVLNENTNFDDLEEAEDKAETEEDKAEVEDERAETEVDKAEVEEEKTEIEEPESEKAEVESEKAEAEEENVEPEAEKAETEESDQVVAVEEELSTEEKPVSVEAHPEEAHPEEAHSEEAHSEEAQPVEEEPITEEVPAVETKAEPVREVIEEELVASAHEEVEQPKMEHDNACRKSKRRLSWCIIACSILVGIVVGGLSTIFLVGTKYDRLLSTRTIESLVSSLQDKKDVVADSLKLTADSIAEKPVEGVEEPSEAVQPGKQDAEKTVEAEIPAEPEASMKAVTPAEPEVPVKPEASVKVETPAESKTPAEPKTNEVKSKPVVKPTPVKPTPKPKAAPKYLSEQIEYKIVGTITTYTIREGETLTRVALRYYGNKKIWPYLVLHNKNVIKNPDNVPVGTTIRVPKLEPKTLQ